MTAPDFMVENYMVLKAFHVIAVISWMAVLLYLPRLFVYHSQEEKGSATSQTFKIMQNRLMRMIGMPAMMATWVFGALMIWADTSLFSQGWFHVKLTAVILMTGIHHVFLKWHKAFLNDANTKSPKFFKIVNEIPTVLMIIIVFMVIVKPF